MMNEHTRGKMLAVIGAQYGSEGKGAIVKHIADEYQVHVRVGSPNAGHTIYWRGERHVMQSIPCGWVNPDARIVIGRGALLNLRQLAHEVEHIERYYPNFKSRLFIDMNAGVLDECFHQQEGGVDGEMHRRIGSTGEGVGPARMARLERDPSKFRMFKSAAEECGLSACMVSNTPHMLAVWQDMGVDILLEGTQGSALSLLHSCWPYCTSIDTNAAAILSECGIAPSRLTDVLLVARTFPIRVAGNSGPMRNETTWEEVSARVGYTVTERTTVTKKTRRVAYWDDELFENACLLNAPTQVALTFADYIDPDLRGYSDTVRSWNDVPSDKLVDFIGGRSSEFKRKLRYIGTGPDSVMEVR